MAAFEGDAPSLPDSFKIDPTVRIGPAAFMYQMLQSLAVLNAGVCRFQMGLVGVVAAAVSRPRNGVQIIV